MRGGVLCNAEFIESSDKGLPKDQLQPWSLNSSVRTKPGKIGTFFASMSCLNSWAGLEPDLLNLDRISHPNLQELRKSSLGMFLIYRVKTERRL